MQGPLFQVSEACDDGFAPYELAEISVEALGARTPVFGVHVLGHLEEQGQRESLGVRLAYLSDFNAN